MSRWQHVLAVLAIVAVPTAALADQKSDCTKGIAMIKAQLKKKHPPEVRDKLQKALGGAEQEVTEGDWKECLDFVGDARKALKK